jgi:hypothetical protein
LASFQPVSDGVLGHIRFGKVMRQQFGLNFRDFGKMCFQRLGNSPVHVSPIGSQQRAVGYILH